jgi:hypothetical protein
MRVFILLAWLILPVMGAVYHLGPGQEKMILDDAGRQIREARRLVDNENWSDAIASLERALELLPADQAAEAHRLRVEKAKAQMMARQLPAAHADLKVLVDELQNEQDVDPALLADARAALANSQYYMTWLMRLEGVPRETWEPEVESARQLYRLLAQTSAEAGDRAASEGHQQDLEATIRLARMDLSELQGLPLPSQ